MFQFSGFATLSICLQHIGLPHSDTGGSRVVCTSPPIFAAYRVLRRLREPRHPPCALGSLPFLRRGATRAANGIFSKPPYFGRPFGGPIAFSALLASLFLPALSMNFLPPFTRFQKRPRLMGRPILAEGRNGRTNRHRTDPAPFGAVPPTGRCSQTIFSPSTLASPVEDQGFEPRTPCVQGRCSSQLS